MKSRLFLVLLLSVAGVTLSYGQGEKKPRTIDDYRPRTLRELRTLLPETFRTALVERGGDSGTKDLRQIVHAELFPSRVKATYSGEKRQLPESKRQIIIGWANQFAGVPEFYTAPYQTELLFAEDGKNYWLAVRKEFPEEAWKKDEALDLCVIKLGHARIGDELEPVLLVERVIRPPAGS